MPTYPTPSDPVNALRRADGTTVRHSNDHGRIIEIGENAKHYGAKGDGVSDDTVALQAWIDAAVGTTTSPFTDNGGSAVLPGGVYCISSTLFIGRHTGSATGQSNALHVSGSNGAIGSHSTNSGGATWLKWIGADGDGPMVEVHNVNGTTLSGINFDGALLADVGLKLSHSTGDQNPHSILVENCTFRRAVTYNVLIGGLSADESNADVANLTFFRCKWEHNLTGAARKTRSHVRATSQETLPVNYIACGWGGDHGQNWTVDHHLELSGGIHNIIGGLMGSSNVAAILYNVNPIDGVSPVPPSVNAMGLESQGDRTFLKWDYSTSRTTSAGQRATVLTGVSIGADSDPGFVPDTDDIQWDPDDAIADYSPLILEGVRMSDNLNILSPNAKVFVNGLLFTDSGGAIIGETDRVAGFWWDGTPGLIQNFFARTPDAFKVGSGATGFRPNAAAAGVGAIWYDTDYDAPIFSNGSTWGVATLSGTAPVFELAPLTVAIDNATHVGIVVTAFSAQTATLQQWNDSGGSTLAAVTAAGSFVGPQFAGPLFVVQGDGTHGQVRVVEGTATNTGHIRLVTPAGNNTVKMGDSATDFLVALQNAADMIVTGGSVVTSGAALNTTATDGFLYIPTCAGTPTGVPTAQTGTVPMIFDTTNKILYIGVGGAWVGGTAPGVFS